MDAADQAATGDGGPKLLAVPEPCAGRRAGCECDDCLVRHAGAHISRMLFGRYLVQQGICTDEIEGEAPTPLPADSTPIAAWQNGDTR